MLSAAPLLCVFFLSLVSHARLDAQHNRAHSDFLGTCHKIATEISSASQVYFPPAPQYTSDISHSALSSIQESACSVEPGSAEDVSKILKILGSCRTPFAVKGGGHTTNPGFSSTPGLQIALSRLNSTRVNVKDGTVEIGPGVTWDQVYETLSPTGVNVIGGRIPGVGVSGLTLGGGYSYKSNQYGLAIDNVAGYELVLPNGTIKHVTPKDDDLWFGLRGGLNNFGIVTKFILKSHPQTDISAGILIYTENKLDQIKEAVVKFQQKNDTKAAIVIPIAYTSGQITVGCFLFYDAPTLPGGIFDDFLAIQHAQGNISTMSYSDYILSVNSLGADNLNNTRLFYEGVPVTRYSPAVFDALVNNSRFWGERIYDLDPTAFVISSLEPFDRGLFSHGSPSAYPPDRSRAVFPSVINIGWSNASLDDTMADILRDGAKTIRGVALADGQDLSNAAVYVNYALFDTPLEDMYGGNVARLHQIKTEIDPKGVMDLAGGFKF